MGVAGGAALSALTFAVPALRAGKIVATIGKFATRSVVAGAGLSTGASFLGPIIRGSNGLNYKTPELVEAPSSSEEFQAYNCKELSTYA